jgi:hypothetical protein
VGGHSFAKEGRFADGEVCESQAWYSLEDASESGWFVSEGFWYRDVHECQVEY